MPEDFISLNINLTNYFLFSGDGSTVDTVVGTGDEGGFFGSQECCHGAHFFNGTGPVQLNMRSIIIQKAVNDLLFAHALLIRHLLHHLIYQWRFDECETDCVDKNSIIPILLGQRLTEIVEGPF